MLFRFKAPSGFDYGEVAILIIVGNAVQHLAFDDRQATADRVRIVEFARSSRAQLIEIGIGIMFGRIVICEGEF